jgi:hypothetical protein
LRTIHELATGSGSGISGGQVDRRKIGIGICGQTGGLMI